MQVYVEKAIGDLPPLPTAIFKIVKATENDPADTREVEKVVSAEPAIASKLLRVVNSAYFGLPREISSINQAVTILGLHQVRNIVLSIGVLNALSKSRYGTDHIVRALWERSFGTAVCASILARNKRLPNKDQEVMFVAGLLHEIGALFFLSNFTSVYTTIIQKSASESIELVEVERLVLHADHARIGGMLADRWELPIELATLIGGHEDPANCKNQPGAEVIHCADRIVYDLLGSSVTGYQAPASKDVMKAVRLSDAELEELKAEVTERIESAAQMLGVLA